MAENNKKPFYQDIINTAKSIGAIFKDLINEQKENIKQKKLDKENGITPEKEERFDISSDDIKKEYESVPKRTASYTVLITIVLLMIMTVLTVNEQVSNVDKERLKATEVDDEVVSDGEVEIAIDEKGWKHYQSKRIDRVVANTAKELNATVATIRDDLNSTTASIGNLVKDMGVKLESMQESISQKLIIQNSKVEEKIKERLEKFKDEFSKNASNSQTPFLTKDMKFLPPPLSGLDKKDQSVLTASQMQGADSNNYDHQAADVAERNITIEYITPDDDSYDYSKTTIDTMQIATSSQATSLFFENNVTVEKKKEQLHLLKGLANATLLTGIQVKTFGSSGSRSPVPVVFSVDGSTFIANNETQSIDDCLVSGVATGNINTSKADILITDISCSGYNTKGEKVVFEKEVKGWVVGEDGSFGLSGRLIDSSGKVITKMIALSMIEAATEAVVLATQPTNVVSFGTDDSTGVVPMTGNNSLLNASQGGLAKGVKRGLDHVYEHYTEIMSGMYPTISVLAGKKISILFKGGEDLSPKVYDTMDIYDEFEVER